MTDECKNVCITMKKYKKLKNKEADFIQKCTLNCQIETKRKLL